MGEQSCIIVDGTDRTDRTIDRTDRIMHCFRKIINTNKKKE